MGIPNTDWDCCSDGPMATDQCGVGQGDCDTDAECSGNLRCGRNNCKADFSTAASNWFRTADCCISSP